MIKQLKSPAMLLFLLTGSLMVYAQNNPHQKKNDIVSAIIANSRFIQIPGPNPILKEGNPGDWDESYLGLAE